MSKVSFRARALDAAKPMPVYRATEIPDMKDFAQINRSVPQMPTGMEKEEETEHHLQRALSAQQVYGSSEALVIPIPEVQDISERYSFLYPDDYKPTKQYVHIQAFNMDQEIPDYDMDSEDDQWLNVQTKKMDITPIKFEEMMDRLEKGSGQQVVTVQEAKLLLKEDDDLIMAVYDYWLNKRLKMQRPLIATVKNEKRDGTTTNNPYVAFRRRTEKMQTRKNRKNDEVSYEKMLKLRRDLQKTLTLLELLKRREKSKKELLQLTIEILEKRNEMDDFTGSALAEAEEEREKHPTFVAPFALNSHGEWVQTYQGDEFAPVRKKRQYRKRKQTHQNQILPHAIMHHFQHQQQHSMGDIQIMDSSDEDILSPTLSQSDHEDDNNPDGMFAFKRRKNCHYHQPVKSGHGNWPWYGCRDGGRGDMRYRFSLTSLPTGCTGYARRRIGRGGRVIFDRTSTPWDEVLDRLDFGSSYHQSSIYSDYIVYVRDNRIHHFRAKSPPPTDTSPNAGSTSRQLGGSEDGPASDRRQQHSDFDVEGFHSHQDQLLEMQREQQQRLFIDDEHDSAVVLDLESMLHHGRPTSHFTLDCAGAEFAVRALVESADLGSVPFLDENSSANNGTVLASTIGSRVPDNPGSNSTTITTSFVSLFKHSQAEVTKTSTVASSSSTSSLSSISLLQKSSGAQLASSSSSSSSILPPGATILLTKPNGPLISTTYVKQCGLSTSPSASVLQLNFPSSSSPTVPSSSCPAATTTSTVEALQHQCTHSSKVTSGANVYKLPVSASSSSNYDILRPNHEELLFNKDTGIPMDVT